MCGETRILRDAYARNTIAIATRGNTDHYDTGINVNVPSFLRFRSRFRFGAPSKVEFWKIATVPAHLHSKSVRIFARAYFASLFGKCTWLRKSSARGSAWSFLSQIDMFVIFLVLSMMTPSGASSKSLVNQTELYRRL